MDDNYIAQMLEEAFGYSDEQLAAEFDCAAAEASSNPDPRLTPPEDEFAKIMARVNEEKEVEKKTRKVVRIKKVLRPMLVAAVLGTIVLGAGVGVSGKREFEFYKWSDGKYSIGYDNTETLKKEGLKAEAYKTIEQEIGIRAVELFFMPSNMYFEYMDIENGRADMVFSYNNTYIHFHQVLKSVGVSINMVSDRECYKVIKHRAFGDIEIYRNILDEDRVEFSASFAIDNAYYNLNGILEEGDFVKMIEKLGYYSN